MTAPVEIVVDLPFPPSVNRLWEHTRNGIHLSIVYRKWIADANRLGLSQRVGRHRGRIAGPFRARILLNRNFRRADIDNLFKAALDWAQRVELIANDRHNEGGSYDWVAPAEAPHGCRLILTADIPKS